MPGCQIACRGDPRPVAAVLINFKLLWKGDSVENLPECSLTPSSSPTRILSFPTSLQPRMKIPINSPHSLGSRAPSAMQTHPQAAEK
jgi:hypothetical protein